MGPINGGLHFKIRVILGTIPHLVPGSPRPCSGMFLDQFRIVSVSEVQRNSFSLARALKMRDSVLLNSRDNFLVTLPSFSSETWVMYSSLMLGTDVFRDWPFLGCSSWVSLAAAANFLLFLNLPWFEGKC